MENIIEVYVRENNIDVKLEPEDVENLFNNIEPSPREENAESSETETSSDNKQPSKVHKRILTKSDESSSKKRMYSQKYRKEWESVPAYKPWLSESVLGNLYFYCKFCKNNNKCGRTEIDKHMTCRKHIRNSKVLQHRAQKKFTFRGFLCPVFTPFMNKDNDVNYGIISEYANYLHSCGVKGILLNDIIGEGMSLTPSERMKITETWMKACEATKQFLMVQIGGAPLKEVLEMVRHAERKKVNAIVVLPDLYNKPKDHFDLMRYIKLVSDNATNVPLLYHHNPNYTGLKIDMSKFLSDILGEIDSFVGIIYSDDNLKDATLAAQVNENRYTIFIGTDEIMLGALASGFTSLVGTSLNFASDIVHTIRTSLEEDNLSKAKKNQKVINNLLELIYRHGERLPAIKAAMDILTPINVGRVRDPLVSLWQDKVNQMELDLQQYKATIKDREEEYDL